MRFRSVRHKETSYYTLSTLFTADHQDEVARIMELPFVDENSDGRRDPNVCRVQHGEYRFIRRKSPKRGVDVWWGCGIPDVTLAGFPDEPTATTCQIHIANFPWELLGCLAIGTAFGDVEYKGETVTDGRYPRVKGKSYPGLQGSRIAFEKFMDLTAREKEIWIEIVDRFGAPAGTWA